jgi:cytidylate kinase
MIITIDGPSGTGKSTVSKILAEKLRFEHLDTGAFYRAFAVHVSNHPGITLDEPSITSLLSTFSLEIQEEEAKKKYLLCKKDITEELRTSQISQLASKVSVYPKVRKAIVALQREYASQKNVIAEGRDLGSVVFPKASVKFFLTADKEVRAKRRYEELSYKDGSVTSENGLQKILAEIVERDQRDTTRENSPLICPQGAIIIDTSEMTVEQVIHAMHKVVELRLFKKKRVKRFFKSSFYRFVINGFNLLFSLFYRFEVYGRENIQEYGGIIASNHSSFLDPPILACAAKNRVHFLARESLFKVPVLKNLIRLLNAHPIKGAMGDHGVIRIIQKLIQIDEKVIMFPEGTRSCDGSIKPLKKGVANIIIRTGSTVYPAYIDGAYSIWSRNSKLPKLFGKVRVVFGKPIHATKFALLDKRVAQDLMTEELSHSLNNLKKWIDQGAKGPIP